LKETRPLWPPQRGVGLREPNLGKTNPRVSLYYSLAICFVPSLADLIIFLTLTRLVVVIIFENFSFALFTPPLGDFHEPSRPASCSAARPRARPRSAVSSLARARFPRRACPLAPPCLARVVSALGVASSSAPTRARLVRRTLSVALRVRVFAQRSGVARRARDTIVYPLTPSTPRLLYALITLFILIR
jgi:hypothetical protein